MGHGVSSDWDLDYIEDYVPFAIHRFHSHPIEDDLEEIVLVLSHGTKYEINGVRVVRKMPLNIFRKYLMENFDILFKRKEFVWPKQFPITSVIENDT